CRTDRKGASVHGSGHQRLSGRLNPEQKSLRSTGVPRIELKNVAVTFENRVTGQKVTATEAVNLTVADGEFVALVGPSGCGKSTLLNAICGLVEYSGEILVDGGPVSDHRRSIGYMFQENTLLPWRTTRANAAIGLE